MSPKELLYIEDALGHATHMKSCCTQGASSITDPAISNLVQGMVSRHQQIFDKFYQLLK